MTAQGRYSVDRQRLAELMVAEQTDFARRHARSREMYEHARRSLLAGVPMNWMVRWVGGFPVFVESASGVDVYDVDGHRYIDFCLGDTGAMAGHGPAPTIAAVERQLRRGITHMLPTEDATWVGEELSRRFGLPYWQFTLSATDANRFSLRLAREISGRRLIAVHDHNYHGSVDETIAALDVEGRIVARIGSVGPAVDPDVTTRVVPFNDLAGLERALVDRHVAALLIEPALTNVGIVLPAPDYLEGVRDLTRQTGTLLIVDETHTLCAGPGGMTRTERLEPDMVVIGKAIGGGIPVGAYGLSDDVADRVTAHMRTDAADVGGIGGTLAGYALSMAATRATLGEVLTDSAFERMIALGQRWEQGVAGVIRSRGAPWHVTRLGCRAEYHFMPEPARDGADQNAHADVELDRFLHLWAMNRGILLTPFHNMALMSPATTEAHVDRHTEVFADALDHLLG